MGINGQCSNCLFVHSFNNYDTPAECVLNRFLHVMLYQHLAWHHLPKKPLGECGNKTNLNEPSYNLCWLLSLSVLMLESKLHVGNPNVIYLMDR
jgi:hypothetical protein